MRVLSIVMTEGCNMNCSYCNVDKLSKKSIDPDLFLETFYVERAKTPDERIQVDFYGGEPLLHFNKIQYILENLKDDNVQFFMPTNGILLTQNKLDILNKYNVEISLSFDGLWQDMNRPQLSGRSSTHVYEDKKELFKGIPNFKIHTMIYPGCYNLLENHLHLLEYGANPQMTVIEDIGVWDDDSVNKLKQGIDEIFDWYIEDTTREFPETIKYFLKSVVLNKSKGYSVPYCGAGDSHLSFSENNLIACNRFKDEPNLEEKIPMFINMKECETCEIKHYCRKGCLYENIKNGGPIVQVCDIFKHFFDKINKTLIILKDDKNFRNLIQNMIKEEYGFRSN